MLLFQKAQAVASVEKGKKTSTKSNEKIDLKNEASEDTFFIDVSSIFGGFGHHFGVACWGRFWSKIGTINETNNDESVIAFWMHFG